MKSTSLAHPVGHAGWNPPTPLALDQQSPQWFDPFRSAQKACSNRWRENDPPGARTRESEANKFTEPTSHSEFVASFSAWKNPSQLWKRDKDYYNDTINAAGNPKAPNICAESVWPSSLAKKKLPMKFTSSLEANGDTSCPFKPLLLPAMLDFCNPSCLALPVHNRALSPLWTEHRKPHPIILSSAQLGIADSTNPKGPILPTVQAEGRDRPKSVILT